MGNVFDRNVCPFSAIFLFGGVLKGMVNSCMFVGTYIYLV